MNSVSQEVTVWGIHAGKTGDADRLFKEQNVVGLGWQKLTDLSKLEPSREAFKEAYAKAYPEKKAAGIPVSAGQLFRFVHEVEAGDLVAYPAKAERRVHIGVLGGDYRYRPDVDAAYPHQRRVTWKTTVPRTYFSQGALYELGSAMSLFLLKNYAEEYLAALDGKPHVVDTDEDETVAIVAEEIEQATRDFVLKSLSRELKGHPLTDFVANLLNTMGYRCRVSPPGPDGGIDILAHKDELGFVPPIVKVQVKAGDGSVGSQAVQALYGNIASGEFGLLVTLGSFTSQAAGFARGRSNLRLVDGSELVRLILNHYDELDSRYKGLIPMKRVFIPEGVQQGE